MPYKALIFDLDGTLVDSAPDLANAINRVLADRGAAPLPLPQIKSMIGDGATQLVQRALAASALPSELVAPALKQFFAYYTADPTAHTTLYPGVEETLRELAASGDFRMAVCTNKPAEPAEEILRRFGIASLFERVIGGDTWPFRKPDPRMLTELLREMNERGSGVSTAELAAALAIDDALMVGDSEIDAATARDAGMAFALVGYGYRRGPAEQITRTVAFEQFAELGGFLGA